MTHYIMMQVTDEDLGERIDKAKDLAKEKNMPVKFPDEYSDHFLMVFPVGYSE